MGTKTANGKLFPMRLLGISFFFTWEIIISPFDRANGITGAFSSSLNGNLFSGITAVLLIVFACYAHITRRNIWKTPIVIAAGVCGCLVPLFDIVSLYLPSNAAFVFGICSLIVKSLANAGLFLMWHACLSEYQARTAWTAYAGSFVVTPCLFFIISALGTVALDIAAFALPVLTCVFYFMSKRLPSENDMPEEPMSWKFPWRPVIVMMAFSFAYRLSERFNGDLQFAGELGRLVIALIVLICIIALFDRIKLTILYGSCLAIMVAALLFTSIFDLSDDWGIRDFLVSAGYSGFTLYLYLILNTICYRFKAPSEWLFGITRAACLVMSIPASMLGTWLTGVETWNYVVVTIDIVIVVIVVLGLFCMMNRRDETTWGIKANRLVTTDNGTISENFNTGSHLEDHVHRCALIARKYGLTHREEEVLSLLSQGYSFQMIEGSLCIAHGTLRVHIQHIYAKLSVHSYEEACEIVENWKL